jgi:hypothetical protein
MKKINGYIIVDKHMEGFANKLEIAEYKGIHRTYSIVYYLLFDDTEVKKIACNSKCGFDEIYINDYFFTDYNIVDRILKTLTPEDQACFEVIALYSESLSTIYSEFWCNLPLEFLGWDLLPDGGGSLLQLGYHFVPEKFSDFTNFINRNGLISTSSCLDDYVKKFMLLSQSNIVEPAYQEQCVRSYEVYRVLK